MAKTVHTFHRRMFNAIRSRDADAAVAIMERMLAHGAERLQQMPRGA